MAWEKHGARSYFYRSVRRNGRVTKVYYGAGHLGKFAAAADDLRKAERTAAAEAVRASRNLVDAAVALTMELCRACEMLAASALLAAGFHRPSRHAWRTWRRGRRELQKPG